MQQVSQYNMQQVSQYNSKSELHSGDCLTHCSRETPKRLSGKQCRPRSVAAERDI